MEFVASRMTNRSRYSQDLVSRRTRRAFCELAVSFGVLRTIEEAFEDEGFHLVCEPDVSRGQRRGLFYAYDKSVDWCDAHQVARATRVFEDILSWSVDNSWESGEDSITKLSRLLNGDGYTLDDQLHIRPKGLDLPPLDTEHIRDAPALREYLVRLDGAIEEDPPLALGQAKSLIEATSKWILEELGQDYDDRATINILIKKVQTALKVHPNTIAPTKKGRDSIVRILSNLAQVAIGVAELRNEYGPEHGRTRSSGGLGPRHARLAAGVARTYSQFLLETLRDRSAQASCSKSTDE